MSHDARSDLDALRTSDEFLTALSHGADPSAGEDELAGLLLDARRDIEAPMPDAPDVTAVASGASAGDAPAHGGASVTELAPRHRHARHQRGHFSLKNHPLVSGMIGAAAATLLIAGVGAAGFNVGEPKGSVSEVELAGELEELEKASESGDHGAVMERVAEMRRRLGLPETATKTETRTRTQSVAPEQETVVETETREADPAKGPSDKPQQDQSARPERETVTQTVGGGADAPGAADSAPERATATETVVVTETGTVANGTTEGSVRAPENAPEDPAEPTDLEDLTGAPHSATE